MASEAIIAVTALIFGLALLFFSSDKAIKNLVNFASALGASTLMVGFVLASVGTDLPEIANDIISSALGHGNITVGDSFGSILAQISLMLGLLPFLGGTYKVNKRRCTIIGICEVAALTFAVLIAGSGYISRISALFLVSSWLIFMIIIRKVTKKKVEEETLTARTQGRPLYHLTLASLSFIGVAVGAYIVIRSVIILSEIFHASEYVISFFMVAIGTSLPELIVELAALRRKQYALAIGDAIGSCIVDATLSVGIGPLFFPITVSGELALITGLYALLISIIVISTLSLRARHDKKSGILFISLYLLSYAFLYIM